MSAAATAARPVALERRTDFALAGFKGPRAVEWAGAQGLPLPPAANRFERSEDGSLLVARLGSVEFFVEETTAGVPAAAGGAPSIAELRAALEARPSGVYPVLREDSAFRLAGEGVHDVLAQVCNVDFTVLSVSSTRVVMTLMAGVAVIVIPGTGHYSIWCDPTFGAYLGETLAAVVADGGGIISGESA